MRGGGGGRSTKKIFAQGIRKRIGKRILARQLNLINLRATAEKKFKERI